MENIVLTLAASMAAGWLFYKMKVPGGILVGGIIGTTILSLITGRAEMPYLARLTAQIIAGAFIGTTVEREDIRKLRTLYKPFGIVIASLLILNIATGTIIWKISGLDYLTALLCCIPGGMSDTPLIAAELGADMTSVVILQFVRMVVGVGVFPAVILHLTKDEDELYAKEEKKRETQAAPADGKKKSDGSMLLTVGALCFAAVCGLIGRKLGVPSGALIFSMLGTLALKLFGLPIRFPKWIKRAAQILSGAYIGCSVGMDTLIKLPTLIIPAILIVSIYMANAFITGRILAATCGVTRREGMLMVTPAGASDMALISSDIGVNSPNLIVLQVLRMVTAIGVFPNLDLFLVHLIE